MSLFLQKMEKFDKDICEARLTGTFKEKCKKIRDIKRKLYDSFTEAEKIERVEHFEHEYALYKESVA